MVDRTHRGSATSTRAQRIDRLMLPAVTLLLLFGAAFVVIAWSEAEDAVEQSRRGDQRRVERLAGSVDTILQRRALDLARWVEEHRSLTAPGQERALQRDLDEHVSSGSALTVAWMVVRADGSFAAVGESRPGRLVANGIADDLRTLGRTAASRGEPRVSGRLKLGDEHVFATAVPIDPMPPASQPSAVIQATYLERSAIGSFLGDTGDDDSAPTLLDANGRRLLGPVPRRGGEVVRSDVGTTGWSMRAPHLASSPFLPSWAYPAFAILLAAFAFAYALQDRSQRRLRVRGERRATEVHALYDLASRALYAETIEEQAEDLARSAIQLAGVSSAAVHVVAGDGVPIEHSVGESGRGSSKYRVAIVGPRGPFGELVVGRDADEPLSEEESWVLGTAATLVGAAMHTLASLETERAAAAELQRLDELRSNLLATVAHELLSPLTAVKGVLGLLSMQEDLGDRGREFVDVATERTDRLVALIRDLFDCSLLETGQLDIRPKRQPADELLEAALGAQAAARPGELRLSATPNLMITVDPVRFDQLVNNLVTNAFRHGSPPVEVAVRPAEQGAIVVVSDEGKGIPPSDRAEVFGKFWQGSSGHARTAQGAGLGLALVQGLVRVHGGDISIDSTHADGRGARFTAYFPDTVDDRAALPSSDEVDETPSLA